MLMTALGEERTPAACSAWSKRASVRPPPIAPAERSWRRERRVADCTRSKKVSMAKFLRRWVHEWLGKECKRKWEVEARAQGQGEEDLWGKKWGELADSGWRFVPAAFTFSHISRRSIRMADPAFPIASPPATSC